MMATRLVAIPEDELRMYQQTVDAVRYCTARSMARYEEYRRRRENRWYKQIARVINELPPVVACTVCGIVGATGAAVLFNTIFLPIMRWRCGG